MVVERGVDVSVAINNNGNNIVSVLYVSCMDCTICSERRIAQFALAEDYVAIGIVVCDILRIRKTGEASAAEDCAVDARGGIAEPRRRFAHRQCRSRPRRGEPRQDGRD